MSFDLQVRIDTSQVRPATQQAQADLSKTEDAADQTTAALGKLGAAGAQAGQQVAAGMKDAASQVGATGETFKDFFDRIGSEQARVFQQIRGPWQQYESDLRATNALYHDGAITLIEYEAASARLATRLEALHESNLTPQLKLEADLYSQIVGPLKRYEAELQALDTLLKHEQITLEQYDEQLAKVQRRAEASGALAKTQGPVFNAELAGKSLAPMQGPAFDPNQAGRGLTEELKREEDLLKRLQAPLKEYEQSMQSLDTLYKKEKIDLDAYNQELDRIQRRAQSAGVIGAVQGPVHNPDLAGKSSGGKDDHGNRAVELVDAVAPKFGAAGDVLGGLVTKGTIATGAVVALATELVHLGDEYIVLSNKAQKVTDKGSSVNETLEQQLALSKQLHGSLEATLELYDAVRDGTDDLNLSQKQQIDLAREIGQAVLAEGKGVESAEGLMNRLTFAFANGVITGRDLRSIMKQFPDIGAAFVQTMGHSRQELIAMGNKGQISAEMLIESFRKMNKEMAEKVDKQTETSGQKWQHFKDWVTVSAGGAGDAISDMAHESAVANAQIEAGITIDEKSIAEQREAARVLRLRAEATKLLAGEQERNAKTTQLASVAGSLGIEFAPFDETQANKVAELRIQMSQLGIETDDVFEAAHAKASLFGRKLEEIQERKDAEKIAEDVKRIYNALHGADDLLEDQQKRWHAVADDIRVTGDAISKLQATRFVSGAPQTQDERDLILKQRNAQTEQKNADFGKSMIGYAQGINTARAELEALNRAAAAGLIGGDALRQKYDQLETTLNDGRLPEAIKIMEGLTLPVQQAARDFAALNALLRQGRIDVSDYAGELDKVAKTGKSGDAVILSEGIARVHQEIERGLLSWNDYHAEIQRVIKDYETLHTMAGSATGLSFRIEPKGPAGPPSLTGPTYRPDAPKSILDGTLGQQLKDNLTQQIWSGPQLVPGNSDATKQLNEQLEEANKLATEFVAPAVKYENTLKQIDLALHTVGLTEDQVTFLRRKAKETLNQENEALMSQKGPMEQYEAALRRLGDQLEAGDISAKKYADGVDAARVAMLQATGVADTFKGAMQIEWIKMQQDADHFGASVANMAVNDMGKFTDAVVAAANGAQVSWTQMADSMIQDLERIFLKMEETKLIGWISSIGSNSLGEGVGSGGSEAGTIIDSGELAGTLGTVARSTTNGSPATITPPGAYPYPPGPSGETTRGSPMPAPTVQIHNHYDSSIAVAAIGSANGQSAILNVLRANSPAVRSALGIRDR